MQAAREAEGLGSSQCDALVRASIRATIDAVSHGRVAIVRGDEVLAQAVREWQYSVARVDELLATSTSKDEKTVVLDSVEAAVEFLDARRNIPLVVLQGQDGKDADLKRELEHRFGACVMTSDGVFDHHLIARHKEVVSEIIADESQRMSDPLVDSWGPERVAIVDEAHVNRCLLHLSEVDDDGDAGLDRRSAAGVMLERIKPGVVTPRWIRGNAERGECHVHRSNGHDNGTRILMLHGGANVCYSPHAYAPLASRLAVTTGMTVVVPDYRLAPEFIYPAALDDAEAALAWVWNLPGTRQVFVLGDSSGAALCLSLALYRADKHRIAGLVLLSAWLDMTARTRAYETRKAADPVYNSADAFNERLETRRLAAKYWPEPADFTDGKIHPFYVSREKLANLPPTFMIVGDAEVCRDDTTIFARNARRAGAQAVSLDIWPKLWHVFPMYSEGTHIPRINVPLAEANVAIRRIVRWLHHYSGRLGMPNLDSESNTTLCPLRSTDNVRPTDDEYY